MSFSPMVPAIFFTKGVEDFQGRECAKLLGHKVHGCEGEAVADRVGMTTTNGIGNGGFWIPRCDAVTEGALKILVERIFRSTLNQEGVVALLAKTSVDVNCHNMLSLFQRFLKRIPSACCS